ncbi:MAG: glycosyltransferase [Bacteroidales bacterium]|jgi:glycosyltransferase involved in cell wall biosynthesis|nr:glycosyltransferase [Bacteroidales bacterium]
MIITVSVTNDLVVDQRVHKVCTTLKQNNYQVKLIGRKFNNSKIIEREYDTCRLKLLFNKSFLFYAEYNIRLFLYLLFTKTDAFLSNDTDSLLANYLVSKIRRKPLIFDAHEMFPEIPEVIDRKFVRWFWSKIEDRIFPKLKYAYTVCQSIADIYNERYKINMQVIRNIPFAERITVINPAITIANPVINTERKKILLYQGAVNIGRGLEWMIDTMPYLEDYVFYVIGNGDVLDELKTKVKNNGLEDQVVFVGKIPFEELSAYTRCADIGINLLENKGLNYYYALPNRIFDYIRNHIPVLTVDFPEIRKIVERYNVGTLVDNYEPVFLAKTIREMSAKGKNEKDFAEANADLSWENESIVLLRIIRAAFDSN